MLIKTNFKKTTLKKVISTIFSLIMVLAMVLPPLAPQPLYASAGDSPQDLRQAVGPVQEEPDIFMEEEEMAEQNGLRIALSEGAEVPDQLDAREVAETEPLRADEISELSAMLSPLPEYVDDAQEFRLPDEPLPPPRTGEVIEATFPPEESQTNEIDSADGPLEVLRFAPEGELPIAPFLNVTFNQPMVPLATLEELRQQDVPVNITPELPGVWKWLGTRTLSFEYRFDEANSDQANADENSAGDGGINVDRFPKATEYTVEIPAGTTSATGNELAEAVTWSFRTPPPVVQVFAPDRRTPQKTDAPIFLRFDQIVDPEAVLPFISVSASGERYPVRLLTEDELAAEADKETRMAGLIEKSLDGRWIALRTESDLPVSTTITVDVLPGTPSAEGPLTTESVQSYSFRTFAKLIIQDHRCGYGNNACQPLYDPFIIRFNNPLDAEAFDEDWVSVEPEIPGMVVNYGGTNITINGATQGRTKYVVTIDGDVQDMFGQTLGQDEVLTFDVGAARPMLTGPQQHLVTLDPSAASPAVSVYSVNQPSLRVRLYTVQPSDWTAYSKYREEYYRNQTPPDPPGELVSEELITIQGEPDELVETSIDLQDALGNSNTGHVIVIVENPADVRRTEPIQTWAQVTSIGLDAFTENDEMVAWATYLMDGTPAADVELSLFGDGDNLFSSGTTAADGTEMLTLQDQARLLVGQIGDDTALLPPSPYGYGSWYANKVDDRLAWYVLDDRQMYRPGEEVHIKGWIRQIEMQKGGGVALFTDAQTVRYRLMGSQGNDIVEDEVNLNSAGGFDFAITLPEKANLGYASLILSVSGASDNQNEREYRHSIQIQEFRRPEFEVTAGNETTGPYYIGDSATIFAEAGYFAGGALPNAETFWSVSGSPTNYNPPNWPEYVFGERVPWWFYGDFGGDGYRDESSFANFNSVTDASGKHFLEMDFDAPSDPDATPKPYSVVASGRVMDLNRQAWSASTTLMVHPSKLYVGLRSDTYFVRKGEPLTIDAIVTDVDGKAKAGRMVTVRAARMVWQQRGNESQEIATDIQECTLISTAFPETRATACEFETNEGGRYEITATTTDRDGRTNQTKMIRWVSGGKQPPARNVEREQVTLIPSQDEFAPGDVAEILVQSPFAPAQGLLTISRNGILRTESFEMSEETTILTVPIEEDQIPALHIQVDVVGAAERLNDEGDADPDLPMRPAFASANLSLRIPPTSRTLALEIDPAQSALGPGESTSIDVTLTDAAGDPVAGAELVAVVVDEAILALSNYQLADPIETFYQDYGSRLRGFYGRSTIVLANPLELTPDSPMAAAPANGGGGDAKMNTRSLSNTLGPAGPVGAPAPMAATAMSESAAMGDSDVMDDSADAMAYDGDENRQALNESGQPESIQIRTDFNPLALFAPEVKTDANGKATIEVDLPDNLTRYRIMVVAAADDNQFGHAESNLTARLPLMVRPSAPRFLRFGDSFELPVVIQNQTDEEMEVSILAQASNIHFTDNADQEEANEEAENAEIEEVGRRVLVPANDRVEVRFPATTISAGEARFQLAVVSGSSSDAAVVDNIPVYTPATTEAFATYGVIDGSSNGPIAITQPLVAPEDVFTQFGGLEIDTSSTALQALTDALLYLVEYPYECSEQRASRIMAVAALRDVLTAFDAEGLPEAAEIEAQVDRDIIELQAMQNQDGGFPVWMRSRRSIPYYSIYVAHALQLAKDKGFEITDETQQRSSNYLRNIESYYPSTYSQRTRWALSAYALYTRNLMGDVDPSKARALYAEAGLEKMPIEGLAWLLHIFGPDAASATQADEIRRHFTNRAVETAGAANFTTSYGEDDYLMLHSNRRTDGVILDALIADSPNSDLIPKVVTGLLAQRTRGRWRNTQENSFILLALDTYFNTFEAQTPDFVANVWLGEEYVGGQEFRGRSTDRHSIDVPMDYLAETSGTQDLIVSNDGTGRLYYRLGLKYAPTDLKMPPEEMGFLVQRTYEAVDDPEDVTQDEDGMWRIKLGARVRTRVTMVADNRRYHVALVDPLPAGFEIINPALAVSEEIPADPNDEATASTWWWRGTWYNHQNLRDDRAEAFSTLLWDGVHNYSYVARATTPGEFVAAPAKAEEMYSPEVFGRSASDWVIVE